MGNEANWNTFTQTGKVSDYLAYVREEKGRNGWENAAKEERGTRERESDRCFRQLPLVNTTNVLSF